MIKLTQIRNYGKKYKCEGVIKPNLDGKTYLEKSYQILLSSKIKRAKCPKCETTSKRFTTYTRTIQDLPFNNTPVYILINIHNFKCSKCSNSSFAETLDFAGKRQVRTHELNAYILKNVANYSSNKLAKKLKDEGINISHDTCDNFINNKVNPQKYMGNSAEIIGIDDVAIRKGNNYSTLIYEQSSKLPIMMGLGRTQKDAERILSQLKNVKAVTRDRSQAYKKAIENCFPEAVVSADRYHLVKNLGDYILELIIKIIKSKFLFILDNEIIEKPEIKNFAKSEAYMIKEMIKDFTYDNSPIYENGELKIIDTKERSKTSAKYIETIEKKKNKQKIAIAVRKDREKGLTIRQLYTKYKIGERTVAKYIKMTDDEVSKMVDINEFTKKKTKMGDYSYIIYKMLKDGIQRQLIVAYVKKQGCLAKDNQINTYIHLIAKNNEIELAKDSEKFKVNQSKNKVVKISTKELGAFMLTTSEEKKESYSCRKINKYYDLIVKEYPYFKELKECYEQFREILMIRKDEKELCGFIKKYEDFKSENEDKKHDGAYKQINEALGTFVKGIKRDFAAIRNAMSQSLNSRFVEGLNNKFKVLKRIVYRRSGIVNLFNRFFLHCTHDRQDFNFLEFTKLMG